MKTAFQISSLGKTRIVAVLAGALLLTGWSIASAEEPPESSLWILPAALSTDARLGTHLNRIVSFTNPTTLREES